VLSNVDWSGWRVEGGRGAAPRKNAGRCEWTADSLTPASKVLVGSTGVCVAQRRGGHTTDVGDRPVTVPNLSGWTELGRLRPAKVCILETAGEQMFLDGRHVHGKAWLVGRGWGRAIAGSTDIVSIFFPSDSIVVDHVPLRKECCAE